MRHFVKHLVSKKWILIEIVGYIAHRKYLFWGPENAWGTLKKCKFDACLLEMIITFKTKRKNKGLLLFKFKKFKTENLDLEINLASRYD